MPSRTLARFTAAATALHWKDVGEEPAFSGEARHVWLRRLTTEYAVRVYKVTAERAAELVASGEHFEPCEATDPGAWPYTVIDLDR